MLSRQTSKKTASLSAICLQPSLGKLIVSDAKIITVMDVECCGEWPEDENGNPFECFIDAKAITALAGKETDIAVWKNEYNRHYLTGCEAVGVLAQYQCDGASFPDWQRVMPTEDKKECSITINASAIVPLRKFLSEHRGKTKFEKDFRSVVLHCTPESQELQLRIMDASNKEIATEYFHIKVPPTHYLQQVFNLKRFYLATQADFTGEIAFYHTSGSYAATFSGECRRTLLICYRSNLFVELD